MTTASTKYSKLAIGIRRMSFGISVEAPSSSPLTAVYGCPQVLVMPLHVSIDIYICLLSLCKFVLQVNILQQGVPQLNYSLCYNSVCLNL